MGHGTSSRGGANRPGSSTHDALVLAPRQGRAERQRGHQIGAGPRRRPPLLLESAQRGRSMAPRRFRLCASCPTPPKRVAAFARVQGQSMLASRHPTTQPQSQQRNVGEQTKHGAQHAQRASARMPASSSMPSRPSTRFVGPCSSASSAISRCWVPIASGTPARGGSGAPAGKNWAPDAPNDTESVRCARGCCPVARPGGFRSSLTKFDRRHPGAGPPASASPIFTASRRAAASTASALPLSGSSTIC